MNYFASLSESNKRLLKVIASLVLIIILVIGFFYFFTKNSTIEPLMVKKYDYRSALQLSVSGQDVKPLQNFFIEKVKSNSKDNEAKSSVYWIVHRFFDNGGNIYEIYDFVSAHPEVAFLKEAETIYPEAFNTIKTTKVANWSGESVLALLGYYEVLDKYGYGDVALWGIASNKHSEFAYMAKKTSLRKDITRERKLEALNFKSDMMKKSVYYADKVTDFLMVNTQKSASLTDLKTVPMIPDDLLVGLNQYGSAIENLKSLGMVMGVPYSPSKIYDFNNDLASSTVPRLYFFTNYLYASSLVYGGDATPVSVKIPLARVVAYAEKTDKSLWKKTIDRVVNSKTANETSMYNYEVAKKLALLDEGFKTWLKKNGWTDQDFR